MDGALAGVVLPRRYGRREARFVRRLWYVCGWGWDSEDVGRCGDECSVWEGGLPSEELLRGVW